MVNVVGKKNQKFLTLVKEISYNISEISDSKVTSNINRWYNVFTGNNLYFYFQPHKDKYEIFSAIRPQRQARWTGYLYRPRHMRFHLLDYTKQNYGELETARRSHSKYVDNHSRTT